MKLLYYSTKKIKGQYAESMNKSNLDSICGVFPTFLK